MSELEGSHDGLSHNAPHVSSDGHGQGIHLPRPTTWPAVMAVGVTMFGAGLVVNIVFSLVGVVVFFIALAGWMRELQNEG